MEVLPDLRRLRRRLGRGVDRPGERRTPAWQPGQRRRRRGSAVTGWGAAGVQLGCGDRRTMAYAGGFWRKPCVATGRRSGWSRPICLVISWRPISWRPSRSVPSRIRTCAHGSGVRLLSDLANLCTLPAWIRSLVAQDAHLIPCISRIMEISVAMQGSELSPDYCSEGPSRNVPGTIQA